MPGWKFASWNWEKRIKISNVRSVKLKYCMCIKHWIWMNWSICLWLNVIWLTSSKYPYRYYCDIGIRCKPDLFFVFNRCEWEKNDNKFEFQGASRGVWYKLKSTQHTEWTHTTTKKPLVSSLHIHTHARTHMHAHNHCMYWECKRGRKFHAFIHTHTNEQLKLVYIFII